MNIKKQHKNIELKSLTLISSPTELNSLFAFLPNQYEPTLFKIWSIYKTLIYHCVNFCIKFLKISDLKKGEGLLLARNNWVKPQFLFREWIKPPISRARDDFDLFFATLKSFSLYENVIYMKCKFKK